MLKLNSLIASLSLCICVFAQDNVKFEIDFTKRLNNEISLYRLRDRTSLKINNNSEKDIKAKIIFTITKGNEVVYQTNIHQAPVLKISSGENYFEGDIIISNEASHIILNFDSSVHLSYDLFYIKNNESLKHIALSCTAEKNEDETVSVVVEEIHEIAQYRTFNDIKLNLTHKYLTETIDKKINVSESAVAYFQMQQGLNSISNPSVIKK